MTCDGRCTVNPLMSPPFREFDSPAWIPDGKAGSTQPRPQPSSALTAFAGLLETASALSPIVSRCSSLCEQRRGCTGIARTQTQRCTGKRLLDLAPGITSRRCCPQGHREVMARRDVCVRRCHLLERAVSAPEPCPLTVGHMLGVHRPENPEASTPAPASTVSSPRPPGRPDRPEAGAVVRAPATASETGCRSPAVARSE